MKIAVVGSGGIGGYFGGRLAKAGKDVHFIARGAHLQAMKTKGLKIDSLDGGFVVNPVKATDDISSVGQVDVVLVCVKAWQVEEVAKQLKPLLDEHTLVIPLQNGVDAPGILNQVIGEPHVLAGMCKIFSEMVAPGHIAHVGTTPMLFLGELDNSKSQRVLAMQEFFESAGIKTIVPDDIHKELWNKFLFIAAMSGVGAVTRAAIGVTRELPETRVLMIEAMNEIVNVAQAHGVNLTTSAVSQTMNFIDSFPPSSTTSMQRDIMAGRPSELLSHNGAVVRLGNQVDVVTPINDFIYSSLLPQERQARK